MNAACIVYETSKNCLTATKLNRHYGADMSSMDSAMCAALCNNDKHHFYFCYPNLVSNKSNFNNSCIWCKDLCNDTCCSEECRTAIDLEVTLIDDTVLIETHCDF
jgi:hypothetical protein